MSQDEKCFRRRLLAWYSHSNRDFCWRQETTSTFVILLAEFLLRKTRAESVDSALPAIVTRYPDVTALARADAGELARLLRPLGLQNLRAGALVAIAKSLIEHHDGRVPDQANELLSLPHIGRYAANAILCFAHRRNRAIVDANIARIYGRAFGLDVPAEIHKANELWSFAQQMLPRAGFRVYNWAMLDLGGLVCRARRPLCHECPVSLMCLAHLAGRCGCSSKLQLAATKRRTHAEDPMATKKKSIRAIYRSGVHR